MFLYPTHLPTSIFLILEPKSKAAFNVRVYEIFFTYVLIYYVLYVIAYSLVHTKEFVSILNKQIYFYRKGLKAGLFKRKLRVCRKI